METAFLPIDNVREALLAALDEGPVVLTAPTGSGKSTRTPLWLAERGRPGDGPVLVVEPRRVACRALAARVAETSGATLGQGVGYAVRDERRATRDTRVLFVTPGVALRMARSGELPRLRALVLDEFHERSLDLDLLLALALREPPPAMVVMSATIAGDHTAAHIGGVHVRGEGRLFPVDIRYAPNGVVTPDADGLEGRVAAALRAAGDDSGDVLVFLPGKGEIIAASRAIQSLSREQSLEVLELHGGLTLRDQSRIFRPGKRRRVILSTNVAETSLTVPRIGVVIDAGLVRRTQYHGGRGYLMLTAVARDSADQRAGRAGRLGPGVCYRLWRQDAKLAAATPPEIHREALGPLVLAAAACGSPDLSLPFLDPPRPFAVDAARESLRELGALDASGALTARGERMFGLPLDAHLGRLIIEGEQRGTLEASLALAAALSSTRRMFTGRPADPELDLRAGGCDATALIRAVWEGEPGPHCLSRAALDEARQASRRYRRFLGNAEGPRRLDRKALAETLMAAWPRCAHVARRRRRYVGWSNGGTELSLGRESALDALAGSDRPEDKVEAALVLESRAFGRTETEKTLLITAAMPVPMRWLSEAGLGRERLAGCSLERRKVVAKMERVYAGKVLGVREITPRGLMAREAIRDLFLRGRLFKKALKESRERHAIAGLHARLEGQEPPPEFADWVLARLEELGLEGPEDLALLEDEDLMPEALPVWVREQLEKDYPRALAIGDARYRIDYDVRTKTATLHQIGGNRRTAPPTAFLPRLPGWRLRWEHKNRVQMLRGR